MSIKSFKIVLDSGDNNSFTDDEYNANSYTGNNIYSNHYYL